MKMGWQTIGALIGLVRHDDVEPGFYIYADDALDSLRSPSDSVFVAPASTFDEDMNEVPPGVVIEEGLGDFCSFELLEDVVSHMLQSNPQADTTQIIEAINYYMENDAFLQS